MDLHGFRSTDRWLQPGRRFFADQSHAARSLRNRATRTNCRTSSSDPARQEMVARSKGALMSVARVVEISSTSTKSFEDAVVQGIARANQTLRNVKSAWVKEQEAKVDDGKVVAYKVNLKITFVLDGAA